MIILVLKEGLGNQLFQYAAGRSLAHKLNTSLKIDTSSYGHNKLRKYSLHHFCIEENIISGYRRFFFKLKARAIYFLNKLGFSIRLNKFVQSGFHFTPQFFDINNNMWIEGYWQSEKYFLQIEDIIRQELVVKEAPDLYNESILKKIKQSNSVSLHIRRGDYVNDKVVNALHGVCTLRYYEQAIEHIKKELQDPFFFIFSDDMEWVKKNLVIKGADFYHIENNVNKDYEDLRLMYSCKHNIIANSSFSWWGAWLNNNPDKIIIAPQKWTQGGYYNPDLIPGDWLQIDA